MTYHDTVDLVRAVAWPLAALAAVVVLRPLLPRLLRDLGRRATRISVYQFAVELAPPAPAGVISDLTVELFNAPIPAGESVSYIQLLLSQVAQPNAADYMIVDLGEGESWLTSRLFIWADMLHRVRGLRRLVFVGRIGGIDRRFIGVADAAGVREALAARFNWLGQDYVGAYSEIAKQQESGVVDLMRGTLTPSAASAIVLKFIERAQAKPRQADAHEWQKLGEGRGAKWEHARWIDPVRLARLLPIDESRVVDSLRTPRSELSHAVLRARGDFVGVVDEDGRFVGLANRAALLERASRGAYPD